MGPLEAIRSFPLSPRPCYVGFSGGGDSLALLVALVQCGWPVTAVHFNHQLRGEDARADARFCREFCRSRKIPFRGFRLDVTGSRLPGESLESAGRRLRLEMWTRLTKENGRLVFLAHHAGDVMEELFLRILRGGGASGLVGLRPLRTLENGVALGRPLLECRKEELEEFLRANGVEKWCLDATNLQPVGSRNRIRNDLLPWWRRTFGTDQGILATVHALREDAEFLEEAARNALPESPTIADWRRVPAALMPRVLRERFHLPLPPSSESVHRVLRELHREHPGKNNLLIPLGKDVTLVLNRKRGLLLKK